MNALDRYANEAWFEGNRAHRLMLERDALEEELEFAYAEIEAWRELCRELVRAQRSAPES